MARDYQELMKQIPVPMTRRKDAIFVSWHTLANSMKQFYGQPLHYVTYVLVKQWDQSRLGTVAAEKPMAWAALFILGELNLQLIWDVEEVHGRCTSHTHLANLWLSDPDHAFVDEVVPSSKSVA